MRVSFRIGPAAILLSAGLPPLSPPHEMITPFQIDEDNRQPDLAVRIRREAPPAGVKGLPAVGEHENHWRLFPWGEGWRLEVLDSFTHLQVKQVALISKGFDRADLHLVSPIGHLGEVMAPFIQWWLAGWLALRRQGMILHGCAVAREEDGLAFIGPSGAGKTTLAQLCLDRKEGGLTVLNDERIVIWKGPKGWRVGGTPWSGMLWKVSPITAPLTGLFTLKKAPVNRMAPVPPMQFMAQILSEAFHPVWSRERMEGLLEGAGRLVEQVPNGAFRFRNDSSAVNFLQGFLQRSCAPSLSISP